MKMRAIKNVICSLIRKTGEIMFKPNMLSNDVLLNDIWNVLQNINAGINKIDLSDCEQYTLLKEIHKALPLYEYDESKLFRVGRNHDGGYVMSNELSGDLIAYSFGICDDVSWDECMVRMGYDVFQYDHTIDNLPVCLPEFHWKKLGIGPEDKSDLRRLDTLIRDNCHENKSGMVLKMDVEGAEWDSIDALDENTLLQFDQIVMEIHNLTEVNNIEKKLRVLNKLTKLFYMIHIHGNNYSKVCFLGDIITPDCCEITLINKNKGEMMLTDKHLPIVIDQPNNRLVSDVYLRKWNV